MSSKTTKIAVGTVAFVAVAGFVGFGLWKASQPAPEVFQGQIEAQEADIAPKVTARIAQILVKEGDQIAVNIPAYKVNLLVSAQELKKRAKKLRPFQPRVKTGWLSRYQRLVGPADIGAVLQ